MQYEYLTYDEAEELYREALDQEPVKIGSLEYSTSEVLETADPTAYRTGLDDFIDSLVDDEYIIESVNESDFAQCEVCGE